MPCTIPARRWAASLAGMAVWGLAATWAAPAAAADGRDGLSVRAAEVFARYGSMPKGVTAEGEAVGFPAVTEVSYEANRNRFTLNHNSFQYDSPVPRADMKAIIVGLENDFRRSRKMRLGVSLRTDMRLIVYGAMNDNVAAIKDLAQVDRILGGTVHATPAFLRGVRLPKNYRPELARHRAIWSAARFNFTHYTFVAQPNTTLYRRAGFQLVPSLTPVIPNAARDGGHLPDRARIQQGILGEPEDVRNFQFLKDNINEFLRMKELVRAAQIGEAAAFVRMLKQHNIDLEALSRQL